MVYKKKYIIPLVEFEEVEQTDCLCDISAGASYQPWGDCAKSSYTSFTDDDFDGSFENPLASPFEQTNNEFEYSMNENW